MTNYDGDLDRASTSVQTKVRTYDAAAGSQCKPAMDIIVEGIHTQAASGEKLSQIDSLWLKYICERHAASKLNAATHEGCVETTLALQRLAQQADDLNLPTLAKTLQGLASIAYRDHGMCVDAQAASKANTEAEDPYARTDSWEATMAASSDVANVVGRAIALGFALGKLGMRIFGKR